MKTAYAVDLYIEDCNYRNLAPKTIEAYKWALSRLINQGDEMPSNAAELRRILTVANVADETRLDLWRATRTFYNWLERNQGEENLMRSVPAPIVRARFPRTLSDSEIQSLLTAAASRRDLTLLAVLLDTGARVGEVANLTWPMVSPEGMEVYGKTGSRFVPISGRVRDLMEGIGDGHYVWVGRSGRLTIHGIKLMVRRTMLRAGLGMPKAGAHTLRHTFAKRFLRQGGNLPTLQRLLGHASIESTMIYSRMADADLIIQHRKYDPLKGFTLEV